jgi:phosphotransferase system  glucose/maltose/N-acetylglucosamine-specific IIC component
MAVSFLKMFFYLAVAIGYVLLNRENAKPFMAVFLLLYVVYTAFEVVEFLKVVKQKN